MRSQVEKAKYHCNIEEQIEIDLKERFVKDGTMVTTTYGGKRETIPRWEAAYVFRPAVARGDLGLMLTEFLGIGKIKDLIVQNAKSKFDKPTAYFTMGVPIAWSYC